MESKPKQELCRIAFYDNILTADFTGRAKGRGVYLCRNRDCFEKAMKKRALQRSFKTALDAETVERVFAELQQFVDEQK